MEEELEEDDDEELDDDDDVDVVVEGKGKKGKHPLLFCRYKMTQKITLVFIFPDTCMFNCYDSHQLSWGQVTIIYVIHLLTGQQQ